MLNIEQLLYFDGLRADINMEINRCNSKIFAAQQTIVCEQENIRHLKYKLDLMVTILDQTDLEWVKKIENYYKSNS